MLLLAGFCFVLLSSGIKGSPSLHFKNLSLATIYFPPKPHSALLASSVFLTAPNVQSKGLMLVPVPDGAAQRLLPSSWFDTTKTAAIIFFTLQCSELLLWLCVLHSSFVPLTNN